MNMLKWVVAISSSIALVACGGGGSNAGTSPFDPNSSSGTPTAADLSLALSSTQLDDTGSQTITVTATAVDASRNAVAGVPMTISADNGAIVVASATSTDAQGSVTATVSAGADLSNRIITVTATSGTLVRTAAFQVTGADLKVLLNPAIIAPGTAGQVRYTLVDKNANPMVGQTITVSAPGLTSATDVTDSNGVYTYNYSAPATGGLLDITATAGGVTKVSTVQVQSGTSSIPDAVGTVASASVSANPSVVAVNSATTNNRTEIRALFLGANNAPIEHIRVRFDLDGDANSIGGSMVSGTNVVYSDPNGNATSAYVPGSRSSPTDGLTIRACWDYTDFAAGTCPNQATTTVTVASEALAVSIGTDNTISEGAGGLTYIKKFVVLVVDAAGQAKADVQITPSVDLTSYIKGYYDGPSLWNRGASPVPGSVGFLGPTCGNEDTNRNGVLESGEDFNGNGQLDPRKSDVAISIVGSSKTDSTGVAILQLQYPKNVATWVNFSILVAASGVSGTEGRATWIGNLPADAASFKSPDTPAFVVSPYGVAAVCTDPN